MKDGCFMIPGHQEGIHGRMTDDLADSFASHPALKRTSPTTSADHNLLELAMDAKIIIPGRQRRWIRDPHCIRGRGHGTWVCCGPINPKCIDLQREMRTWEDICQEVAGRLHGCKLVIVTVAVINGRIGTIAWCDG